MNEGKKDRRDPIRTIKARNPVAKNATSAIGGGAAGAHKDKKKAMKQGDVKHKKAEFAESYEAHLARRLEEATVNPQFINVQVTKILAREAQRMTNAPIEQLLAPLMKEYNLTLQQINGMVPGGLKKAAGEYGVTVKGIAETTPRHFGPKGAGTELARQIRANGDLDRAKQPEPSGVPRKNEFNITTPKDKIQVKKNKGVAEGTGPQSKLDQKIIHLLTNGIPADAIARKLDIPVAWVDEVAEYNMPDSAIDYNDPRNTPPTNRFGEGVAEGIVDTIRSKNYARLADRSAAKRATALDNFDEPEHQKQTDIMKQRNLKSRLLNKKGVAEDEGDPEGLPELTVELAQHIRDQIGTEGPHAICKSVEWGDGAADDLVLLIQNALDEFIGDDNVEEDSALTQHRNRSAQADADLAKREAERKKNPGAASGDRIKELEKRYPAKEGWTHDSLADELFEHERTYEDKLQNQLKKLTKR